MRILLSEGSSLTARETVSALGPCGHRLEVCDPDPLCLARFSVHVAARHRVPPVGANPLAYVRAVAGLLARGEHDVLLPTHEQVYALTAFRDLLPGTVAVALPPFEALRSLQSKASFSGLLDRLRLPQPDTVVHERLRSADLPREYPYYVKAAIGTAGRAVWRVAGDGDRDALLARPPSPGEMLVQAQAPGDYRQALGLFDRGRLVALHCSQARAVGMGGSASARVSVDAGGVRADVERLGRELDWHGALTLDYLHDGAARYIEANPRLVEPMNATASGLNLADLLVRLSLGQLDDGPVGTGRAGVRSHGLMAVLMGTSDRTRSRRATLGVLVDAVRRRGVFASSREVLAPVKDDPPSAVPATYIATRLLIQPRSAATLAEHAVRSYALTPEAYATIDAARSQPVEPSPPS